MDTVLGEYKWLTLAQEEVDNLNQNLGKIWKPHWRIFSPKKSRHFMSKFYQIFNQIVFVALVRLLSYFCEAR